MQELQIRLHLDESLLSDLLFTKGWQMPAILCEIKKSNNKDSDVDSNIPKSSQHTLRK